MNIPTQLTFTFSKSTVETLEKRLKYVPNSQLKHQNDVYIVNFEHDYIIPFSSVSIVDFEQVNVSWECPGEPYVSSSIF